MSPQEPQEGDRVTVDPTMADEEVLPAPTGHDTDPEIEGGQGDELADMPQKQQIFPECR